jgi:hypothetical protein
MKKFLIALAVVAVAGATYVATAPGGQTASPTGKQFTALKKEVSALSKKVSSLKGKLAKEETTISSLSTTLNDDDGFIKTCLIAGGAAPVTQYGDAGGTFGYSYSNDGTTYFLTTALDATASGDLVSGYLQLVSPSCLSASSLKRRGDLTEHRVHFSSVKH